jgi:four helix bundle protein
MKIKNFEEIEAWKEARNLNKLIYQITTRDPFKKDFGLTGQIQRASITVMANIAEGFDRQSDKEFIHYLNIASSSASEIQSHLYAALDLAYIKEEEFKTLYDQTTKVKKIQNPLRSDNEGKKTHKRLYRLPKGEKA